MGILLTGMGSDEGHGMQEILRLEVSTIAQNEETSVVFGMPNMRLHWEPSCTSCLCKRSLSCCQSSWLPANGDKHMTTHTTAPAGHTSKSTIEILIVEDSAIQAELLRRTLTHHGYTVVVAQHGAHALEIVRKRPPTLILSDIAMPVMDGYAMCYP